MFSYTNHTLMPEALETWPVALMQHVLPRHLEIIFRINQDLLDVARRAAARTTTRFLRAPVADRRVAASAACAWRTCRSSAATRSTACRRCTPTCWCKTIFADFASLWPERFTNMTNGVTPRRWLAQANPGLAALLDRTHRHAAGGSTSTSCASCDEHGRQRGVPRRVHARSSAPTRRGWRRYIERTTGIVVDPASLFDVQVKRIHEYKRQLLNVLHVVTRYQAILADPDARLACRAR